MRFAPAAEHGSGTQRKEIMKYRQIHLDFHTAPVIPDVGTDFDAEEFAETLVRAHVNSINIFAKCHHGMCYYPTKVGTVHPSLRFDLMGQMIEALHRHGISCPLYFPIGWEEDAAEHTEWLELGKDGIPGHKRPDDASYYSWRKLCLNNDEYKAYIKRQLTELLDGYDVDGLWFDIIFQQQCCCPTCVSEMKRLGRNPESERDVLWHDEYVLRKFQKEMNDFLAGFGKPVPVFYNSAWKPNSGYGDTAIDNRSLLQDHLEIESLPSGEWGYNHFPLLVNYHNRNNGPIVGMNGKFHLSWGDHGSLKNREALEYECFRMIANGCACSVGDQLHPRGAMNRAAYERIGEVYREIEKLEPVCDGSTKIADIGVVVSADFHERNTDSDEGVMRMLSELHETYDFIPVTDDLSRYRLVILPDRIAVDSAFSAKLKAYLDGGGRVIASGRSTDPEALGIRMVSECEYEPAYAVIGDGVIPGAEPLEYVFYKRGVCVESDLPVLAYIGNPYYNRTAECFSSHRHFPYDRTSDRPAILLGEKVGYCAFPLFDDYITNGNRIYRDVFECLLKALLPEPTVCVTAPTCTELTARRAKDGGLLVHLLNYIPERRTKTIDIVDTRLPIYNTEISVADGHRYTVARAIRSGTEVPVTTGPDGRWHAVIPVIDGYDCIYFL